MSVSVVSPVFIGRSDEVNPTERGPKPHPKWLVTDLAAVDYDNLLVHRGRLVMIDLATWSTSSPTRSAVASSIATPRTSPPGSQELVTLTQILRC
jgi:hypothetical protein